MWKLEKYPANDRPFWVVLFVLLFIHTSKCSSSIGKPPTVSATPTTMDDGVQRIGVGEVLIVDEFGREARSYWDSADTEEKVEAVTVYGGMEVVSGGSTNDGGPDVVRGHHFKEEPEDSGEEESSDAILPEENSVKENLSETTLLDCVLQGDITCIQKKAFRALQKLIQMSHPVTFSGSHSSTTGEEQVTSKESEDGMEKVDKGVLQGAQGWWTVNGGVTPVPDGGAGGAGMVGNVMSAVSANGGMSRLLEEVRDLVVDLVSNVISLQDDDEDRKRDIEKRSEGGKKKRRRRSVVAKKGAGSVPTYVGVKEPSAVKSAEKSEEAVPDGVAGKSVESTAVQRGKKKKRNGIGSILMGVMIIKSIFSYLGMVFSHVLQLKQLGISILAFFVSLVRLFLLFRQSNNEKQPQTDTKVVYLKPQYNHGHYGDHSQSQYYNPGEHYKRSFDVSPNPEPNQESAHEIAYGAQIPSDIK